MSRGTLKCPLIAATALALSFFTQNVAQLTDCRNYARSRDPVSRLYFLNNACPIRGPIPNTAACFCMPCWSLSFIPLRLRQTLARPAAGVSARPALPTGPKSEAASTNLSCCTFYLRNSPEATSERVDGILARSIGAHIGVTETTNMTSVTRLSGAPMFPVSAALIKAI
jgi:hypothetical protein